MTRFDLPECLNGLCEKDAYRRWLARKAQAHVKRDRKRFGTDSCTVSRYKAMIHEAVCCGGDRDYYTGLPLDWSLISKFDNDAAKQHRSNYLRTFGNLPTLDHTRNCEGQIRFVFCSWRVNDAKNHLSEDEFHELCEQVLAHKRKR